MIIKYIIYPYISLMFLGFFFHVDLSIVCLEVVWEGIGSKILFAFNSAFICGFPVWTSVLYWDLRGEK